MALSMKPEHRAEVVHFYQAYAQELQESFQSGFLHELTRYPHFVVWKTQDIDGKPHKPPYSPIYHRLADTANPASWGTVDQAVKALRTGSYNGIGFVFSKNDPYAGMDFDHCVGTNRSINKRERDIIEFLSTHTHYSPRDGVHTVFEIDKRRFPGQNRKSGNVEFFKSNHYLTITPRLVANTPKSIEKRHIEASYVYLSLFPPEPGQDRKARGDNAATELWTPAASHLTPVSEHTEHGGAAESSNLRKLPPEALNDPVLQELLRGDMSRYDNDHHRADWHFLMKLLHWTGDDVSLSKQIFLNSPLGRRAKAQEPEREGRRGTTNYVDRTIERIIAKRRNPPMKR